jgi:transcriptional regulator with XRE-family HTH domain
VTLNISAQVASGAQIKEARRLLGWSQAKLADKIEMSVLTVKRLETSNGARVAPGAVKKMVAALETAGIKFTRANGNAAVTLTRKEPVAVERMHDTPVGVPEDAPRRRRRKHVDLATFAIERVESEALTIYHKIISCHKDGKIDDETAVRMFDTVKRLYIASKTFTTDDLSNKSKPATVREQLFQADLIELRWAEQFLNRLLRHHARA